MNHREAAAAAAAEMTQPSSNPRELEIMTQIKTLQEELQQLCNSNFWSTELGKRAALWDWRPRRVNAVLRPSTIAVSASYSAQIPTEDQQLFEHMSAGDSASECKDSSGIWRMYYGSGSAVLEIVTAPVPPRDAAEALRTIVPSLVLSFLSSVEVAIAQLMNEQQEKLKQDRRFLDRLHEEQAKVTFLISKEQP